MITVYTQTPDELARSLKSYFLIDDHFVILTIPEEVDDYLNSWFDMFAGYVDDANKKISFKQPFLAITEDIEMYEMLIASFNTKTFNEITDIMSAGASFIESGFLPLDVELICKYMNDNYGNEGLTPNELIIRFFQTLGYLTDSCSPTDKLISTLYANDDTFKYAQHLSLLMTNCDISSLAKTPGYITTLTEILKLIDINVHIAAHELKTRPEA